LVLDLLLIGLGITLEPFPLTAFVLVLSADQGTRKGLAFILGWLACLILVIAAVMLATGDKPPKPQTPPSTAILAVKLALGVILILIGLRQWRRMGRPPKQSAWMAGLSDLSLWSVAGLAVFLQPWALVAAGAATVAQAKLANAGSYLALTGFCLLAMSSFLYLELYALFAGTRADEKLKRLRNWLNTHSGHVVIVVCLLLGFWLAGKSIYLLASHQ
jgi:threonine/homoserine/homoserine lactone efflux protein